MFELRDFQKQSLTALTRPKAHVICVAATGSGKSLIYERTACLPGTRTLLVSPLIALARQQAAQLKAIGLSTLVLAGSQDSVRDLSPEISACVVTPESLCHDSHRSHFQNWRPNFLAVDECHCIWEWGEAFRPAFKKLPGLITDLKIPKSLWLSATLPRAARGPLKKELPKSVKEIGAFGLPEKLFLEIRKTSWQDRAQNLFGWVLKRHDPGIIFVTTRESTERVSRIIQATGKHAVAYHAGMSQEERRAIEKNVREKAVDVIVCTSAFGMGMNYSHLKWVILWQAPSSLLSLAQEIGRVSRANELGHALIYWDYDDFRLHEWSAANSTRRLNELVEVKDFLSASRCRRQSLTQYFDPDAHLERCELNCDYCRPMPFACISPIF